MSDKVEPKTGESPESAKTVKKAPAVPVAKPKETPAPAKPAAPPAAPAPKEDAAPAVAESGDSLDATFKLFGWS